MTYPARDLNLYNITASHDFEHERLSVLYAILSGECDCVITTPDAALSYTIPETHRLGVGVYPIKMVVR